MEKDIGRLQEMAIGLTFRLAAAKGILASLSQAVDQTQEKLHEIVTKLLALNAKIEADRAVEAKAAGEE